MSAAYDGPERRTDEQLSWDQIENRLRKILAEEFTRFKVDIYERSFDPLKQEVEKQAEFCAKHSQDLTRVETLTQEIVDAKLIRRVEVAEARIGLIGKATVVIGTIAGTAVGGLLVAILTHQLKI